jgi:hypothetical protein
MPGAWSCGHGGVKVILVEPAMTDTDLWRKAPETLEAEAAEMSDEYRELYAEHLDGMRKTVPRMQKMRPLPFYQRGYPSWDFQETSAQAESRRRIGRDFLGQRLGTASSFGRNGSDVANAFAECPEVDSNHRPIP